MLKISLDNIKLSKVSPIFLWGTDRTHGVLSTHLDKTTVKTPFDDGLMTEDKYWSRLCKKNQLVRK